MRNYNGDIHHNIYVLLHHIHEEAKDAISEYVVSVFNYVTSNIIKQVKGLSNNFSIKTFNRHKVVYLKKPVIARIAVKKVYRLIGLILLIITNYLLMVYNIFKLNKHFPKLPNFQKLYPINGLTKNEILLSFENLMLIVVYLKNIRVKFWKSSIILEQCPYFHVKNTTSGRHPIITRESTSIIERSTQFKDAIQGLESMHSSHPSAHRKHSNIDKLRFMILRKICCLFYISSSTAERRENAGPIFTLSKTDHRTYACHPRRSDNAKRGKKRMQVSLTNRDLKVMRESLDDI
ncbi:hypothetical protein AGLY_015752 [Aphis glycines]|uniref:Uncharacterized protein n=1 Tax=Aphis glycines TaxID=307491 RepID=A0A6G0T0Y3_APHGL|nr:hypothetical protein AGLY_015752 [Aphis glycines]